MSNHRSSNDPLSDSGTTPKRGAAVRAGEGGERSPGERLQGTAEGCPEIELDIFDPQNFLILVVDDSPDNLQLVGRVLDKAGYATTFASSGAQTLERAPAAQPDLILLDLMMPDISGLEVCKRLQKSSKTKQTPVIFVTASDDKGHLITAFAHGAVDYITKPFSTAELLARVKIHLELKHSRDCLKRAIAKLDHQAKTDVLTGVSNRRHWLTFAKTEFHRAQRYQGIFSVLLIDLDHFKRINDTYGHYGGDQVLIETVRILQQGLRQQDVLARWGGEEFVVLLPETELEAATVVAERLRESVERWVNYPPPGLSYRFTTLSLGIASWAPGDRDMDSVIKRADQALYQAKDGGRNRGVAIAPPALPLVVRPPWA